MTHPQIHPLALALLLAALACSAPSAEIAEISADEVMSAPESTLVLDVRSPSEYAAGHVPGAINIPHDQLESRLSEIAPYRDGKVVVYCERGGRAGTAGDVLVSAGYGDVDHMTGDMAGWRSRGLPSSTEASP